MLNPFNKRKTKFSFYGNCQLDCICEILSKSPEFLETYEYMPVKAVYLLENKDLLDVQNVFKEINLLLYQAVSPTFKNGPEFGSDSVLKFTDGKCSRIQIPSLFFNAYFPDFHEVAVEGYGEIRTSFIGGYHDMNIMYGFVKGLTVDRLLKVYLESNFYDNEFCQGNLSKAFEGLRERETTNGVDVPISAFIEKYYKIVKLFNCQNHPKPILLQFVINNILSILKFDNSVVATKTIMDGIEYPVHPNIYKNLGLKFDNRTEFITGLGPIDNYKKMVELYYDDYKKIDIGVLRKATEKSENVALNFKKVGIDN